VSCEGLIAVFGASIALFVGQPALAVKTAKTFPAATWSEWKSPEQGGWSAEQLQAARRYSESIDAAAVIVVASGRIVSQWGETTRKYSVHSIRKSFLSALYGRAVANGSIRLDATLAELGIDDNAPALNDIEKRARVVDLLKARSGIYHAALYESPDMKARKQARGSHPPRSYWSYNNWDFNALGTIYEAGTGTSIFEAFDRQIAKPLQMQDFELSDTEHVSEEESIHRAYPFRMSARDMARFGLLFLREGRWRGRQLVPSDWVRASTTSYSVAEGDTEYGYSGYGYMWWVAVNGNHFPHVELPDGSFSARGWGGHFIVVIPAYDVVIVHRVNTDLEDNMVSLDQFGKLLDLILRARPTHRP
jgi:CubicO group peptidase (beta-lactamase class C family)